MSSSNLRCRVLVLEFVLIIIASIVFSETFAEQDPDAYDQISDEELIISTVEEKPISGEPKKANKTPAVNRGDRKKDSWRVMSFVKKILDKSDAKTIIFAKDSTFNFYGGKIIEHAHSKNNKAGAAPKNKQNFNTPHYQNGDVTGIPTPVPGDVTSSDDVKAASSGSEGSGSDDTVIVSGHAAGGMIGFDAFMDNETSQEPNETTATDTTTTDNKKYIYISSVLPPKISVVGVPLHLVLDVDFEDNKVEGDSRRIVLSANDQSLSEQWHIDNETKTIHNRQKNLCISFIASSRLVVQPNRTFRVARENNHLIASPCDPENVRQWWLYDHIRRSLYNPHYDLVAEVENDKAEVGGNIRVGDYGGQPRQHFELGPLPFYFSLVNEETGLAVSVYEDRDRPGTPLVLTKLATPPTIGQLWYIDSKDVIRSKINDNVIDASSDTFRSEPFTFDAVHSTSWTFFDGYIINLSDERQVMEPVPKQNDSDLFTLAPKRRHDERIGQKFNIVYSDQTAAVTKENLLTTTSPDPENISDD